MKAEMVKSPEGCSVAAFKRHSGNARARLHVSMLQRFNVVTVHRSDAPTS